MSDLIQSTGDVITVGYERPWRAVYANSATHLVSPTSLNLWQLSSDLTQLLEMPVRVIFWMSNVVPSWKHSVYLSIVMFVPSANHWRGLMIEDILRDLSLAGLLSPGTDRSSKWLLSNILYSEHALCHHRWRVVFLEPAATLLAWPDTCLPWSIHFHRICGAM